MMCISSLRKSVQKVLIPSTPTAVELSPVFILCIYNKMQPETANFAQVQPSCNLHQTTLSDV